MIHFKLVGLLLQSQATSFMGVFMDLIYLPERETSMIKSFKLRALFTKVTVGGTSTSKFLHDETRSIFGHRFEIFDTYDN